MLKSDFETERTSVTSWKSALADETLRNVLVEDCKRILTPKVLRHLPDSLNVSARSEDIDQWIDARDAESTVLTIREKTTSKLLGFMILAELPQHDPLRTVHLGYFFAEESWGKGYATEVLSGLIAHLKPQETPVQLIGGVEKSNIASAKVLLNAGFVIDPEKSDNVTDMFVYEL